MYKVVLIIVLFPFLGFTQTGPAGVGAHASNVLWLKSESIESADGLNITTWTDKSGHSNDFTQPTSSLTPISQTLEINGYTAVRFNKTNGRIRKTGFNDFPSSELTILFVNKNNGETSDGIISYAVAGSDNEYLLYNSNSINPHINGPSIGGTGVDINDNTWHIVNTNWRNSDGDVETWKDGVREAYTSGIQVGQTLTNGGCFALAGEQDAVDNSYSSGQAHFGFFTELIVYNTYVNKAQLIILNNYLSAKYGLNLGLKDIYNEDNNANGDFDHEVAGIGRTNASNIHDDAQGTGIVRILNPTNLGNNEFLIWGHDSGLKSFITSTNIPANISYRLDQVWRVSEVDTLGSAINVGSVDMRFDLSDVCNYDSVSQLVLLIDTDNDGSFSDETPITSPTDLGSSIFEFSGISGLTNNSRFTLGLDCSYRPTQIGPGGVGTYLENILWVKAEDISVADGADVSLWKDASCNWNHLSQPETNFTPVFRLNQLNGLPAVEFNKTLGRIRKVNFNNGPTSDITTIFVNKNNGESNDGIISYATSSSHNDFLLFSSNSISPHVKGSSYNSTVNINDNNWHIVNTGWSNSNGNFDVWKDGNKAHTNTNFKTGQNIALQGCFAVGGEQDAIDNSYDGGQAHFGFFSELIAYNIKLNDAQQIIISNYLSAKYGLSLSVNDVYNEDNAGNGNYDFEVAGIGRVDASNLHDDAQGSAIIRISNPTSLNDNEFLIWGHDNGLEQATEFADVPATVLSRFERVWRASEVNVSNTAVDVGAIDISFDLRFNGDVTTSDLRLLVDEDNDGVFIDETPIAGAVDLGCGVYEFSGVTQITNNTRFTIGTININQTPLPIELINFNAKAIDDKVVSLEWQTETELNNDYFVVEKSINGKEWEALIKVDGAGTSSSKITYNEIDRSPFFGVSYYRLKQVDFNGEFTYSDLSVVDIKVVFSEVLVFPNPTKDRVKIRSNNKNELSMIKIYNLRGEDVTNLCDITLSTDFEYEIDLNNVSKGMYTIRTLSVSTYVIKQ